MSDLKSLVAALRASTEIESVMKFARKEFGVAANDPDFAAACKSPKAGIAWVLAEPSKEFLAEFLGKCAKKGFIPASNGAAVRQPAARAPAAPAKGARASAKAPAKAAPVKARAAKTADAGAPREGSKLDTAYQLLNSNKGVTKEVLESETGASRADSLLWALKLKGYTIENIGERGNPVYRIA